jgi:hypothetical protein
MSGVGDSLPVGSIAMSPGGDAVQHSADGVPQRGHGLSGSGYALPDSSDEVPADGFAVHHPSHGMSDGCDSHDLSANGDSVPGGSHEMSASSDGMCASTRWHSVSDRSGQPHDDIEKRAAIGHQEQTPSAQCINAFVGAAGVVFCRLLV